MDFIDKLEKFLLRPRAKVYHGGSRYSGSDKVFFDLGCYRGNYGRQDKEKKKDGIISMMKKLRDNNYKHPEYTDFHLDLIGWDYFDDILALEPTNEDLFNLYKITGYGKDNKLSTFLNIVKDKDWKLKFFKYGHDYNLDWHTNNAFRNFVSYLKDLDLNDDEWINALTEHINNSIEILKREEIETLIEVSIECIKDNKKCEEFVKKMFNKEIKLSNLFIENKVSQLKIDSKSIIKHFDYNSDLQVKAAFSGLYEILKFNIKDIPYTSKIEFYNIETEYNFILYEEQDNKGLEVLKLLINEMMPALRGAKVSSQEVIDDLNEYFVKKLSYVTLSLNMNTNQKKEKIVKL
jgi:hypothetical protein